MGLFTTRQLLGYTEQKVKFRALFLELFFRRTVNFHTEEVMLDKITGKTPVAAYVSPIVEGKVLRHRGGETRVLRPGYVKPKHEFNYQQAVERLPGEDPSQLNDPAYRRLRIITDNLKQEEHAIVQVEEMQAVMLCCMANTPWKETSSRKLRSILAGRRRITSLRVVVRSGQNRIVTRSILHMILTSTATRPAVL